MHYPPPKAKDGIVARLLLTRHREGKPFTVHYEEANATLLNEFLKEHRKVEEQAVLLHRQESRLNELEANLAQLRERTHPH